MRSRRHSRPRGPATSGARNCASGRDGRGEDGKALARREATAPPPLKAASSTHVPKTDVFGTEPAGFKGPHQDGAGAWRPTSWGSRRCVPKTDVFGTDPQGSVTLTRTVLALGALPARCLKPGAAPAPGPFVVDTATNRLRMMPYAAHGLRYQRYPRRPKPWSKDEVRLRALQERVVCPSCGRPRCCSHVASRTRRRSSASIRSGKLPGEHHQHLDSADLPAFDTIDSCFPDNTRAPAPPPLTFPSRRSPNAPAHLSRWAGSAACPRIPGSSLDSHSAR
jgi:hypothetical protein